MPWYSGATLLHYLETVHISSDRNLIDFRFPVQYVIRPNLDFRGFAGTIASGVVRQGDEVMALPSGSRSRVRSIVTYDGDRPEGFAPMAVTLTLTDEIDVSRGDMLVRPENLPRVDRNLDAMVVWMAEEPLVPGPAVLDQARRQSGHRRGLVAPLSHRRQHAATPGCTGAAAERGRPLRRDAEPSGRVRRLSPEPRDGRVHRDRSPDQRHRRRRHDRRSVERAWVPARQLGRRHAGGDGGTAIVEGHRAGARGPLRSSSRHGAPDRTARLGQDDTRVRGRTPAVRDGPGGDRSRRSRAAKHDQQGSGVHRRGAVREPSPRRGRGALHERSRVDLPLRLRGSERGRARACSAGHRGRTVCRGCPVGTTRDAEDAGGNRARTPGRRPASCRTTLA